MYGLIAKAIELRTPTKMKELLHLLHYDMQTFWQV